MVIHDFRTPSSHINYEAKEMIELLEKTIRLNKKVKSKINKELTKMLENVETQI
jgi:hypothetical protein